MERRYTDQYSHELDLLYKRYYESMESNIYEVKIMLKKIVTCTAIISIFCSDIAFCMLDSERVAHSAFIAKQGGKIIQTTGTYDDRHAPYSTFKVPLALMGYESGILETEDHPKWSFKEEYENNFQGWYSHEKGVAYGWCQEHTPRTFMKYSVLWFSHQITERLGLELFKQYTAKLNYGNRDFSGTPGQNDALLNSWLGTSLEISPHEQVQFLEKLLANELDFSKDAQKMTRKIMDREEEWGGWKLYGKTGGGSANNGWFIGWIEKNGQQIVFAQYLDLADSNLDLEGIPIQKTVGLTAKEIIKKRMLDLLR
ncbi:MAG: class D beta-lactamase [Alphaproteobacteria bacterium]|nr:class D beta-lactamase [Alphaproteobacteria bacterium]